MYIIKSKQIKPWGWTNVILITFGTLFLLLDPPLTAYYKVMWAESNPPLTKVLLFRINSKANSAIHVQFLIDGRKVMPGDTLKSYSFHVIHDTHGDIYMVLWSSNISVSNSEIMIQGKDIVPMMIMIPELIKKSHHFSTIPVISPKDPSELPPYGAKTQKSDSKRNITD